MREYLPTLKLLIISIKTLHKHKISTIPIRSWSSLSFHSCYGDDDMASSKPNPVNDPIIDSTRRTDAAPPRIELSRQVRIANIDAQWRDMGIQGFVRMGANIVDGRLERVVSLSAQYMAVGVIQHCIGFKSNIYLLSLQFLPMARTHHHHPPSIPFPIR